jgi:F-type H+-transporting ATPase subunit b
MNLLFLAAEEGAENGFWLPHDINEVIWGTFAFTLVALLLVKFALQPGKGYFKNRAAGIEEGLEGAASARRDAESETEASRIIEDARQSADALSADIAARAQRDAEAVRERAAVDLAATRNQVEADLSGELSRLALGAAEKVVEDELDAANQQRLIDAYISDIGSQN